MGLGAFNLAERCSRRSWSQVFGDQEKLLELKWKAISFEYTEAGITHYMDFCCYNIEVLTFLFKQLPEKLIVVGAHSWRMKSSAGRSEQNPVIPKNQRGPGFWRIRWELWGQNAKLGQAAFCWRGEWRVPGSAALCREALLLSVFDVFSVQKWGVHGSCRSFTKRRTPASFRMACALNPKQKTRAGPPLRSYLWAPKLCAWAKPSTSLQCSVSPEFPRHSDYLCSCYFY